MKRLESKRIAATVSELAGHYVVVLAGMATDPTQAISEKDAEDIARVVPLLAEATRRLARGRLAKRRAK